MQFDMPAFKDPETGVIMIWDATSKSYVPSQGDQIDGGVPDRSHASGGDNDLFDEATQTERPKNPLQEGWIASVSNRDWFMANWRWDDTDSFCPDCGRELLGDGSCPNSQWHDEATSPPLSAPPQFHHQIPGFPDRVPKRNEMNSDPTFPSMLSHAVTSADDWGSFDFAGPELHEVGKWVIDMDDNFHYEPGGNADHTQLMARDQITRPGALGSVYSDGTADIQRVYPGYQLNQPELEQQLIQAFGEGIHITHVVGGDAAPAEQADHAEGIYLGGRSFGYAWVKERSEGRAMSPGMILVAEHIQPEDFHLYNMAQGIVCATGSTSSHAAIVARQTGIATVVGIGAGYNKIQTGNLLTIDESGVGIFPDEASYQQHLEEQARAYQHAPLMGTPQANQTGLHEYMRRRMMPQNFAHIDEELAHKLANPATLDECPECGDVLMDQDSDKVCTACGHRQPIINTQLDMGAQQPDAAPTDIHQVADLMNRAMGPSLKTAAGFAGEEEIGGANKNRGLDHNPALKEQQGFNEEHGDAPELLKDVDDAGGPLSEGNPRDPEQQQRDALKVVHTLHPLIIEFADSGQDGSGHPILKALDEMLDLAFPGYRVPDVEHHPADETGGPKEHQQHDDGESPEADEAEESEHGDDSSKKKAAMPMPIQPQMPIGGPDQIGTQMQPQGDSYSCPSCGQAHAPGTPCPTGADAQLGDSAALNNQIPGTPFPGMGPMRPRLPGSAVTQKIVTNIHEARRPKMCPFHSELVDYALATDPGTALTSLAQYQFSEQSCKGGFQGHKCRFKPTMVNQSYWDKLDEQQAEQQALREQWGIEEKTEPFSQTETIDQVGDDTSFETSGEGVSPSFDSMPSAVGGGEQTTAAYWRSIVAGEGEPEPPKRPHETPEKPHEPGHGSHRDDVFTDKTGAPLHEGGDYELVSPRYAIPDRITADRVLPDKLIYTVHTDLMDYQEEMTPEELHNEGYTFTQPFTPDSYDGFDGSDNSAGPGMTDSGYQQDDLSTPSTVVSNVDPRLDLSPEAAAMLERAWEVDGAPTGRKQASNPELDWLWGSNIPNEQAFDPQTLAGAFGMGSSHPSTNGSRHMPAPKYAGKDFSAREQREFIEEAGEARNLDKLDLQDTHYLEDPELGEAFLWGE